MSPQHKPDSPFAIIAPGELVTIREKDAEVSVRVYPLAVQQFREHTFTITRWFTVIQGVMKEAAAGGEPVSVAIAAGKLAPLMMGEGLQLVADCCDTPLDDAPLWAMPAIIESWIKQSFGGQRWHPFLAAIENTMEKLTGQSISISAWLSNLSSRPGTRSTTSSTGDNADLTSASSPTADGLGHS